MWPPKPNELLSASSSPSGSAARLAPDDVEVHVVVEVLEVGGRRGQAVVQREERRDRLDRAGGAEQVPGHRLGGRDADAVGRVAERRADRLRLGDVADRRRGRVGVDVHDVGGRGAGRLERPSPWRGPHRRPTGSGCGDVVGVGGDAGAGDLGVDRGAAGLRVLERSRARRRRRPRRARSRRGPCRRGGTRAPARRCGSTAPAWRRSRPAAAGGWPPRCHRRRRRRRGRCGSCRRRTRSPRRPLEQALTGVWTPARAPSSSPTCGGRAVRHQHRHRHRQDAARRPSP